MDVELKIRRTGIRATDSGLYIDLQHRCATSHPVADEKKILLHFGTVLKGEDGMSAYDEAVAGGYQGTRDEFRKLLSELRIFNLDSRPTEGSTNGVESGGVAQCLKELRGIVVPYDLESKSDEAKELFAAIIAQPARPIFIKLAAAPMQYIPCVARVNTNEVRLYGGTTLGANDDARATTQLRYMQIKSDGSVAADYGAWFLLSEKSVIDTLTATYSNRPLSANMGRELADRIDKLSGRLSGYVVDFDLQSGAAAKAVAELIRANTYRPIFIKWASAYRFPAIVVIEGDNVTLRFSALLDDSTTGILGFKGALSIDAAGGVTTTVSGKDLLSVSDIIDDYSTDNASAPVSAAAVKRLNDKVDNLKLFDKKVVAELPTENIGENTIYLILNSESTEANNIYDEYWYVNGAWELIGSFQTEVDLSEYYTKAETDAKLSAAVVSYNDVAPGQSLKAYIAQAETATPYMSVQSAAEGLSVRLAPVVRSVDTAAGTYTLTAEIIDGGVSRLYVIETSLSGGEYIIVGKRVEAPAYMPMSECESDIEMRGDEEGENEYKTVDLSSPRTGFTAGDIKLHGRFDNGENAPEVRALGHGVLYFMDAQVVNDEPYFAAGFFVGASQCLRITYNYAIDTDAYWTVYDLSHSDRMTQSIGGEYNLAFIDWEYSVPPLTAVGHNMYAGHIRLWDVYAMSDAGDYTAECLFDGYGILRIDRYERGGRKYYRGSFVSEDGHRYFVSLDRSEEAGEYGTDVYMQWQLELLPDLEGLDNRVGILETDYNWVEIRVSDCEGDIADMSQEMEAVKNTLPQITITRL